MGAGVAGVAGPGVRSPEGSGGAMGGPIFDYRDILSGNITFLMFYTHTSALVLARLNRDLSESKILVFVVLYCSGVKTSSNILVGDDGSSSSSSDSMICLGLRTTNFTFRRPGPATSGDEVTLLVGEDESSTTVARALPFPFISRESFLEPLGRPRPRRTGCVTSASPCPSTSILSAALETLLESFSRLVDGPGMEGVLGRCNSTGCGVTFGTRPAASHNGHIQLPLGATSRGGSRQSMCQPMSIISSEYYGRLMISLPLSQASQKSIRSCTQQNMVREDMNREGQSIQTSFPFFSHTSQILHSMQYQGYERTVSAMPSIPRHEGCPTEDSELERQS